MPSSLRDVAALFLRLGLTAFGGPAAHIALMHDQVVRRRRWLTDAQFLDLVGLVNLVPGPNSTELAIHLGRRQAGWAGFAAAGVGFIAPAVLIVLCLAWGYKRFGTLPQVAAVLAGVTAVMIAIIVQALWTLGPKAVKGRLTAAVGLAAVALGLAGVNEIALLAGAGIVTAAWSARGRPGAAAPLAALAASPALPLATGGVTAFSHSTLFLVFLKIGAVMYGSGYVLLAFLQADLVTRLGWLTERQLIDAVAIGQVTPGPLFTSATFIGYQLAGLGGALLATVGIFLPSFVFVALTGPLLEQRRRSPLLAAFLEGVNVAALALMAVVSWRLGRVVLADPLLLAAAVAALALLVRTRIGSLWLVGGGAVLGLARALAG